MPERTPYPGPRPFRSNESGLFFGRDIEIRDLVSLSVSHRSVLLYAASGAGKSSLINAGLIPAFRDRGATILPVSRPEAAIMALTKLAETPKRRAQAKRVLLAIDQVEEVFFGGDKGRSGAREFFELIARTLGDSGRLSIVLALREEFLSAIERYSASLPGGLRTRLHLDPLTPAAAAEAIRRPLNGTRRTFAPAAVASLVNRLRLVKGDTADGDYLSEFVDPVHLQVVCRRLWEQLPRSKRRISVSDIDRLADVDRVLSDYYEDALKAAARKGGVPESRLRRWFAKELITPARTRGLSFAQASNQLPPGALRALEERHVIRTEFRLRGKWYELTHDRLISPILASNASHSESRDEVVVNSGITSRDFFSFQIDEAEETVVFNEQGSGVLTRRWKGIELTQTVIDLRIPFQFIPIEPEEEEEAGQPTVKSLGAPKDVSFTVSPPVGRNEKRYIVAKGRLGAGSRLTGFEFRQPLIRAFLTDAELARRAYADAEWKEEYLGVTLPFVAGRLVLRVQFPPSHRGLIPPPHPVAFIHRSETVLPDKTELLKRNFGYSRSEAVLEVEAPEPNISYAISWMPPVRRRGTQRV